MRYFRTVFAVLSIVLLSVVCGFTQSAPTDSASQGTPPAAAPNTPLPAPGTFDQVVDRVITREQAFNEQMRQMHPLVETYIQMLRPDREMGLIPASDQYFLGRFDLSEGVKDRSFMAEPSASHRMLSKVSDLMGVHFLPRGFAQMAILDDNFQRQYYDFNFVRREFLGEIRCLVIDVRPRKGAGNGRFVGRLWVEDRDYNIVRFNGTYEPAPMFSYYLHFDSWRLNVHPGMWLPAYVYSEESGERSGALKNTRFKSQTRFWGYDLQHTRNNEEFTQILVDAPDSVKDQSEAVQDATPVESQRKWERQAEDNVLERLQRVGLLAPEGEVDKVLQTVANNLIVTNNLDIEPEIRARVLLTMPLESFTIGHTIILSRGLLDVLPDEPSLAMVVAHELGHIVLGHQLDTKLAFNDRMFFSDENTFKQLDFNRDPIDEDAADKKALELLENSPYKNKLQSAALFLKALQARSPELKALIHPHLGNGLAEGKSIRMSALMNSAPELEMRRTDQVAALPLGGRIKLDPWTSRVELVKAKPVNLTSPREKMPFEVTPFFPYLSRYSTSGPEKVALTEQPPAK
ncbi:MAG TPA: M48 family metalloprotease [Terriglobales bacterium]|nr:M48 family metalloprotease [Terriglobales bacterium]